jgi:hypothetical protein
MAITSFSKLGDVPVYYDRRFSGDYGHGTLLTFRAEQYFEDQLDQFFFELWNICPFGQAEKIFSAGAYVPGNSGMHGQARAFDLDGIEWSNRKFMTLEDGRRNGDRKFYFGVEAILRKHFGLVLDYCYNQPHWCHFHIDDSASINFSASARSKVLFLQGALINVFGLSVGSSGIDGQWGPNIKNALDQALSKLGINGSISNVNVWKQFLTGTAKEAFGANITPRNMAITQPQPNSSFSLDNPVHFVGTADPEVTTVKLIAEDKYHFNTVSVNSQKWSTYYEFNQGGKRTIVAKGFDDNNRQVASTTVDITLNVTAPISYASPPPNQNLLGSIVNTLADAKQVTQITESFQETTGVFKLNTGELYIEGKPYISVNGSPNAPLLEPLHGSLETSLKYVGRTGQAQFVNSEKIPYFVLPKELSEPLGIQLGDIGVFIYNDQIAYAFFADMCKSLNSIGCSIALANALGSDLIIDDLINRGIADNVICIIFPNSGDGTPQTPNDIQQKGEALFRQLGGNPPL